MSFWMVLFGVLTVISALGVVLSRAPLNSALWLVMTFFLIAAHYALLSADLLAVIQVLVYAGAIMVLIIFVIMLLGADADVTERSSWLTRVAGALAALTLFLTIAYSVSVGLPTDFIEPGTVAGDTKALGQVLYTEFLLPFEVVGLLILAATIGAVVLGADSKRPLKPGRGLKATRERIERELRESN